ncbi:hypothetical protein V8G54_036780 [Vigna mungo]|uniref:Uncharacterized protein n=1 Tax=Vigna mungo TaxID=3915 RepID=A0AAQ3MHW6_VIGMU
MLRCLSKLRCLAVQSRQILTTALFSPAPPPFAVATASFCFHILHLFSSVLSFLFMASPRISSFPFRKSSMLTSRVCHSDRDCYSSLICCHSRERKLRRKPMTPTIFKIISKVEDEIAEDDDAVKKDPFLIFLILK